MSQYPKNGKPLTTEMDRKHADAHVTDVSNHASVTLSFNYVGLFLPYTMLVGFGVSIMLAIIFRFEETTYTHCRVTNYFPSTSAAIATTPSAYIWRLAISICSLPRLIFIIFRYNFYLNNVSCQQALYRCLCHLCFIAEIVENLSLIGLSCISSDDNYDIHEVLFISFQVAAMLHILLMCFVFKMATDDKSEEIASGIYNRQDAIRRKIFFGAMNFLSFFISIYFFFRHQYRCEPGVYSLFAIFEYLVVVTNIMFHQDAWRDFSNRCIIYGGRSIDKKQY